MTITIDDYLPYYNGNLIFSDKSAASTGNMNFWNALLEKSYAKIMGNYEAINYGWQAEALRVLTGAPTYFFFNSDNTAAETWTEIDEALKQNFNVGCDTSSSSVYGLAASHAYHVIGTY